jgi:diguanylate cyclase (GGDEF)-like protein
VCAAFSVVALAADLFGHTLGPPLRPLLPTIAVAWSFCDLLTGFLLFAQFYAAGRILYGIVGAAYAFSGLLTWPAMIAYIEFLPAYPGPGLIQISLVLFLIWHVAFPIVVVGAYVYEGRTEKRLPAPVARIAAIGTPVLVLVAVALVSLAVYAIRDHLPIFVANQLFLPVYRNVPVPIVAALSAAGCLYMIRRPKATGLSLWVTVALFTEFIEALLDWSSPHLGSYAWDTGKLLTLAAATVVLVMLLSEIVGMYEQVTELVRVRGHEAAARMRALRDIAAAEALSEGDYLQMILAVATANIRSASDVFGYLSHRHGGEVTVDSVAEYGAATALQRASDVYTAGRTFSLADDLQGALVAGGEARFWNDLAQRGSMLFVAAGWRGAIGTIVEGAGTSHFLIFGLAGDMTVNPFAESDVAFVDVVASNISQRFKGRAELERFRYHVEHDQLTGLFNRIQFRRLGLAAAADGTLVGLVLIDLDGFRLINERDAHTTLGDELLIEVAACLRLVEKGNVIARLGDDDFAVLLLTNGRGETLAQRLAGYERPFHRPLHAGNRKNEVHVDVTASLGAVSFERGGAGFDELMTRANVALDHAKERGGSCSTIFGPELESIVVQRSLERAELLAAMKSDQFVVEYQPQVELKTRLIESVEALIRWRHPTRGLLQPQLFLASVKRENLMAELTTWVLERVVADLATVALPAGFRCYFNVPAPLLETDTFLARLERLLEKHPGINKSLGLEVTESEVMAQVERAIDSLNRIRDLGLLVAIDDFGTGYSSLSYLKRLPIDVLKLDQSFIRGLPGDANDVALAGVFLSLAKQFSLISVAEGIEKESQAAWLCEQGCLIGQGFLFSHSVSIGRLAEMLAAEAPRRGAGEYVA